MLRARGPVEFFVAFLIRTPHFLYSFTLLLSLFGLFFLTFLPGCVLLGADPHLNCDIPPPPFPPSCNINHSNIRCMFTWIWSTEMFYDHVALPTGNQWKMQSGVWGKKSTSVRVWVWTTKFERPRNDCGSEKYAAGVQTYACGHLMSSYGCTALTCFASLQGKGAVTFTIVRLIFVGEIQSFQPEFNVNFRWGLLAALTDRKLFGLKVTPVWAVRFFALKFSLMWPHLEVCHTEAFSFQRGLWVKCEGAVGRAVSDNSFWQITKK